MDFRTEVIVEKAEKKIEPFERVLCVGSCFADNIGKKFEDFRFRTEANPFGVMYNPASILHTIHKTLFVPDTVLMTLGTNRVYILKETGEIVDNCQKRPQIMFREQDLDISECTEFLDKAVTELKRRNPDVKIIITVSPIRYRKYGFHGSNLSKATLMLAADKITKRHPESVTYFPAYEIVNDELRDYRFYGEDMLHPTPQAVEYIWQKFTEAFFSDDAVSFIRDWKKIADALGHRPFNPESEEYKKFLRNTEERMKTMAEKWNNPSLAQHTRQ